jgi:hypothetical protein
MFELIKRARTQIDASLLYLIKINGEHYWVSVATKIRTWDGPRLPFGFPNAPADFQKKA